MRANLAYYLGGFALTTTPGKAGDAIRSVYLKRHGVGYTASLAALFAERLVDLLGILALAALVAFHFEGNRWLVIGPGGIVLMGLIAMRYEVLLANLQRFLGWFVAPWKRGIDELFGLLSDATGLLRSRLRYRGFVLGILA